MRHKKKHTHTHTTEYLWLVHRDINTKFKMVKFRKMRRVGQRWGWEGGVVNPGHQTLYVMVYFSCYVVDTRIFAIFLKFFE